MGLDKWLKPEDSTKKKKTKESSPIKDKVTNSKHTSKKSLESLLSMLKKYTLICSNSKCKYQKTLMKKQLIEKDKICPRCNKELKIKK